MANQSFQRTVKKLRFLPSAEFKRWGPYAAAFEQLLGCSVSLLCQSVSRLG